MTFGKVLGKIIAVGGYDHGKTVEIYDNDKWSNYGNFPFVSRSIGDYSTATVENEIYFSGFLTEINIIFSFRRDFSNLLIDLSFGSNFFQEAIGMGIRWIQLRKENLKMTE